MGDIRIYYGTLLDPDYIECGCSAFSVSNYSVSFETWLTKSQLSTLNDNIIPGAVKEIYTILGRPTYWDMTFSGENTLRLVPICSGTSNLSNMRHEYIIYPKTIGTSPVEGNSYYIKCKIDSYLSGTSL